MAKNTKEYFLMHKDIRVCLMEITDEGEIGGVKIFHLREGYRGAPNPNS